MKKSPELGFRRRKMVSGFKKHLLHSLSHYSGSINRSYNHIWGFPGGTSGKEPTCQCRRCKRHGFDPWVGKIPWRRVWQPTLVFLPGESHGQRSLEGFSLWGTRESHSTAHTCTTGDGYTTCYPGCRKGTRPLEEGSSLFELAEWTSYAAPTAWQVKG